MRNTLVGYSLFGKVSDCIFTFNWRTCIRKWVAYAVCSISCESLTECDNDVYSIYVLLFEITTRENDKFIFHYAFNEFLQ